MGKKSKVIIVIIAITATAVLIAAVLCPLFINDENYINKHKISESVWYIEYGGSKYYWYRNNGTSYSITGKSIGTKIGYTRYGHGGKYDAYMIDFPQDNVIATETSLMLSSLWIKEGYSFPDISDAKIKEIRIENDNGNYTTFKSTDNNYITLSEIVDTEEQLTSNGGNKPIASVNFLLKEPENLQIITYIYMFGDCLYLSVTDNDWNNFYYKINGQFKNLFLR